MTCLSILDTSLAAEVGRDREGRSEWNRSGRFVSDPPGGSSSSSSNVCWSPFLCPSRAESSSSSIGKNSDEEAEDDDDDDDDGEEKEVRSSFKDTFNASMDALEEALPTRRGISSFYSGKSRSFACLNDASSSSIKSIVKPDNAYSRKRRNLLAHALFSGNSTKATSRTSHMIGINHIGGGGISKKPSGASGTATSSSSSSSTGLSRLALAVAMATTTSRGGSETTEYCSSHNNLSAAKMNLDLMKGVNLPPPYIKGGGRDGDGDGCLSPSSPLYWRSFSVADLRHCGGACSNLGSPDRIS